MLRIKSIKPIPILLFPKLMTAAVQNGNLQCYEIDVRFHRSYDFFYIIPLIYIICDIIVGEEQLCRKHIRFIFDMIICHKESKRR